MKADTFETFYREHYTRVLRFIERRIDSHIAPDICAQCFEIAWRKFDPDEPFGLPWLYQTARNLLGNAYRKRAREFELLRHLRPAANEHEDARIEHLRSEIERLPPLDREALRLTYWEGLTAAEVGEVMRCSEQAAWKRISRAKGKLRDGLQPRLDRGEETADAYI